MGAVDSKTLDSAAAQNKLDLKGKSVSKRDLKQLVAYLTSKGVNVAFHSIDLSFNNLLGSGKGLADLLSACGAIERLYITFSQLDASSVVRMARGLRVQSNGLQLLNLEGNDVCDDGCSALALALTEHEHMLALILTDCKIGSKGASALGAMLRTNKVLRILRLDGNKIGARGTFDIADAFTVNKSLRELDLCRNLIQLRGAKAIIDMLRTNSTLSSVKIDDAELDVDTRHALRDAIRAHAERLHKTKPASPRSPFDSLPPTTAPQAQHAATLAPPVLAVPNALNSPSLATPASPTIFVQQATPVQALAAVPSAADRNSIKMHVMASALGPMVDSLDHVLPAVQRPAKPSPLAPPLAAAHSPLVVVDSSAVSPASRAPAASPVSVTANASSRRRRPSRIKRSQSELKLSLAPVVGLLHDMGLIDGTPGAGESPASPDLLQVPQPKPRHELNPVAMHRPSIALIVEPPADAAHRASVVADAAARAPSIVSSLSAYRLGDRSMSAAGAAVFEPPTIRRRWSGDMSSEKLRQRLSSYVSALSSSSGATGPFDTLRRPSAIDVLYQMSHVDSGAFKFGANSPSMEAVLGDVSDNVDDDDSDRSRHSMLSDD